MSPSAVTNERRHDLDALRATAMLLGIAYHVALSFASGFPWMVQDVSQSKSAYIFQAFVHGFRMQLFMLVSGFFTAMLWRQKGLKALIWHRFRRVLIPCLLGLVTIVPAMIWAGSFASARNQKSKASEPASANIWSAIRLGDAKAMNEHLKVAGALTNLHALYGTTPLTWAALTGQRDLAASLVDRGADVMGRNRDGGTALHAAAFMGEADVVNLLVLRGTDVNATSSSGESPLKSASQSFDVVQYIAGLLGLPADKEKVLKGRERIIQQLKSAGAKDVTGTGDQPSTGSTKLADVYKGLTENPVFILVWFLWFLVWLVGVFCLYALIADKLGWKSTPAWLTLSPTTLLWLVPLTMFPGWFMGSGDGDFGPDTSMGVLPMPHVFAYYALFFFFGVVYHDVNDTTGRLGIHWRWILPVALLVVFPMALELSTGAFGIRGAIFPQKYLHVMAVAFQALYAWLMAFGCMGMFRSLLTRENKTIRYLSDSSYWLYLAHLPLCIAAQAVIHTWPLSVWIKWPLLSIALTGFLLLTYHYLVRYTPIGTLLNGPRKRPSRRHTPNGVGGIAP
jgi:Acyltransferase family/Ankyrin repeats (3 copies)